MPVPTGVFGILVIVCLGVILSERRSKFPLKIVLGGLMLQFALAVLVLKTDGGRNFFDGIGYCVTVVLKGCDVAAGFVFGPLAGDHPDVKWKAVAGIKIVTTIIAFSTLSAIGYHFGILQRVVAVMAWVMSRTLGVSGSESLSCAANVFLGQTEAPFLVRPYLARMTRSELNAVMTGGFATIAAGVMAVYVHMLSVGPGGATDELRAVTIARHFLTASLMSAPAAFVLAKIIVPETAATETGRSVKIEKMIDSRNVLDAATTGASQGMTLAINVIAMLIAFIAIIAVLDFALGGAGRLILKQMQIEDAAHPLASLSLQKILGWVFWPMAYLIGVESADRAAFGSLLGVSIATNEFLAYQSLAKMVAAGEVSERTMRLATYSLCGFANIGSMGIQIAGVGSLAPTRRSDLVSLAPRAMLGGAMASWMTGCIAGLLT